MLGGLVLRANGQLLALGTPKQRTLTSILLVRTNSVVPFHEIIEELWGAVPPKSATANLRTYAARLRATLPPAERDRLIVRPFGYQLCVKAGELDLKVFEDRIASGHAALEKGDAEEALRHLESGLALWRGRLLEDVPHGPVITARDVAISAQRHSAEEDRCEALLMSGRPALAAGPLRSLVAEHPLRERAWALLMRALYATDDLEGALDAYSRARTAMTEALGIEPAEELRHLHLAILRRDLRQPRAVASVTTPRPRQLPPEPTVTGRTAELTKLTDHLGAPGGVVGVHGPAGSGKSALAVGAAHRVADRYPDGQLYLDLRPGRGRDDPLCRLLRGLDVSVTDPDAALASYRSRLADRRMLVLLDNATDAAQVRPLIPSTPRCTVLLTSCPMLSTLDGALHLRVRELGQAESLALLSLHCDPARLREDPDASAELVRLCDRLPLALRIAAARLAARPGRPIRELVELLVDDRCRLDELEAGDLSVLASLLGPYDVLKASERPVDRLAVRVFERLGSLPVASFQVADVARSLWMPVGAVGRAMDRLVEVELLSFDQRDQYRLSELYRLLSRRVATTPACRPAWLMPSA